MYLDVQVKQVNFFSQGVLFITFGAQSYTHVGAIYILQNILQYIFMHIQTSYTKLFCGMKVLVHQLLTVNQTRKLNVLRLSIFDIDIMFL